MKVIDKREEKEVTYKLGDWFEHNGDSSGLCQLIYVPSERMALTDDHASFCGGSIDIPEKITREHIDQLSRYVGKKVNVEIHVISNAEE